jgi:beta-glucosidase/6-phospho-beta-glucosidase/beta-galactosidase
MGLFQSTFLGGFECSSHRRGDGRRLDLMAATAHDRWAANDFRYLREHGIRSARDGIRWHLVEAEPGIYDWSSFLPVFRAARDAGVQVVWDLCHYGWPDGIDVWQDGFIDRFTAFAAATARLARQEGDGGSMFCPINEISYWAWAGGEVGRMNPVARGRGAELKRQLVRASIAAIEAIWSVDPAARIVHVDPVINVVAASDFPQDLAVAESYRLAQFEAWDMLCGRMAPELGGRSEYLDVLGVNFYYDNQWMLGGRELGLGHPLYRPFSDMLAETYARYRRPLFIAETGAEGLSRSAWLRSVSAEARAAVRAGVPVEGLCLYPILQYPGWEDDRICETGLFGAADQQGRRPVCEPLAEALRDEQRLWALAVSDSPLPNQSSSVAAAIA